MVQRLDICGNYIAEPCEEGAYINYEDYVKLEAAVIALLADINRRYPGERFKCPLILKLAEVVGYEPRN